MRFFTSVGATGTLNLSGALGSPGGTAISSAGTLNETSTGLIAGASSLSVSGGTTGLAGGNTYSGATLVTGGTLRMTGSGSIINSSSITINGSGAKLLQTSSAISNPAVMLTQGTIDGTGTIGAVTVGGGTGGIVANGNGSTAALTVSALTFNGAATTNLAVPGATSTASPAIIVSNALTTPNTSAGEVVVNVAPVFPWNDGATYDLISYGSFSGAVADFANGTIGGLSSRQTATLGNDPVGKFITITINGDTPKWTGLDSTAWQVGATGANSNWQLITAGTPTDYIEGDVVLFDDSATSAVTPGFVTINTANVSPTSTTFNNSTINYTLSGSFGIAGGGSLIKNGTASLTINNANTYSGGTMLLAGVLNINNAAALGTGTLTISGGTIDNTSAGSITLNNNPQVWSGNFAFGGTRNLNLGTGAVTMNSNIAITLNNGSNLTVGGVIGGNFGLTATGPGVLTLTAANTYTGGTTINNGSTVSIAVGNNLGTAPAVATTNITLNGGTLRVTTGTADPTATISQLRSIVLGTPGGTINVPFAATGSFTFNSETAVIYTGTISGGNLTVTGGSGTNGTANPYLLELGATNNYTGTTTVNNATVAFLNTAGATAINALPPTTVLNLVNNGWFVMNHSAANQTIAGLTGDATGQIGCTDALANSLSTLTITPAVSQNYVYSGVIGPMSILDKVGSAVNTALTINGAGTQVLAGTNTYTGATLISQGVLQLGNGGATGSLASGSAITDNGTLAFNRSNAITQGTDFAATIGGTGTLVQAGSGTLVLNGANTFGNGATVNAGTLRVANGANGSATGPGPVTLNGGVLAAAANPTGGSIAGLVSAGSGAHIIAPSSGLSPGTFATLNLNGGLTTSSNTTLTFNVGSTNSGTGSNSLPIFTGGDLININGAGLIVGANTNLTFGTDPATPGDYRLIGGSFGSPTLGNFVLPAAPGNTAYSLSTTVDANFIDLVVTVANNSLLTLPAATLSLNMHVADTSTPGVASITNSNASSAGHFTPSSTGTNGLNFNPAGSTSVPASSSVNLNVGWASTSTAGARSGQITIVNNDNGADSSTPKTQAVTGGVYNLASTGFSGATLNFGNYHVGATVPAQTISISDSAPATGGSGGYTEGLDASFGTPSTSGIQTSGSISLLYPEGGTSTALSVGISTSTAGPNAGTVAVSLTSDGTGTSGLANTPLTSQTVTVTGGNVYSGKAQWNIATGDTWATQTNWADTQSSVQLGAPGISGFAGDTATFGAAIGSTSATINLDAVAPVLAGITFNNANAGYTIAQGSGTNRVTLSTGSASPAAITVAAGSHTISAPVTVALGGVNISGAGVLALSGSGNICNGPVAVAGSGTTTISGTSAFNYASNSPVSISVGTGTDTPTLVIRPTSGSTVASANVTATVAAGATLELDGTVSALSDHATPIQRASVQNDGSLIAGDLTSLDAAVQQVGGIDGSGSVTVAGNASLTADHINQTSLVIGAGSVFTLAPSDPSGNPMAALGSASSGLALAGSLTPASSFMASSGNLLGAGAAGSAPSFSLGGGATVSAVPEPSAIVLLMIGAIAALPMLRRIRRRA